MKCSSKTCVVWNSFDTKPGDVACYVYWGLGNNKNDFSIQEIVEGNSNKYRSKYLSFVHDIGHLKVNEKELLEYLDIGLDTSFWWMTIISEKCNYSKSPYIEDIVKLMAFSDWIQGQDYERYVLVSDNVALSKSMNLLLKSQGKGFQHVRALDKKKSENNDKFLFLLKKMPYIFQSFFSISKNILNGFLLKDSNAGSWKKSQARVTFVSYSDNLASSEMKLGRYSSYYWGKLPNFLKNEGVKTNWLHIYVRDGLLSNAIYAKKIVKDFNSSERGVRNHALLQSFISAKVVLEIFSMWLKLLSRYLPVRKSIQSHSKYFWPLLSDDLKKSILGPNAINNIFFQSLFNRAFLLLPTQDCCYYLQENQGWECGMINSYKKSNHHNLIGVPHAAIKYWDLRHYHNKSTLSEKSKYSRPFPERVALNGDSALKLYLDSGYEKKQIIKVEALRYLHLNHIGKLPSKEHGRGNSRNVLVLGDYLIENTFAQLMMLKTAVKKSSAEFNIFFKPHPNCQLSLTKFSDLNMKVVNDPVSNLILFYQTVYVSSRTSASVEAYYAGCSVIAFLDMNKLNSSPLRGYKEVCFVSTAQELLLAIDKSADTCIKDRRSKYFYLNPDLPLWLEHFNKDISIL